MSCRPTFVRGALTTVIGVLHSFPAPAATQQLGTTYFHHDHRGSAVVLSAAERSIIQRIDFEPWGRPRNVPSGTYEHDRVRFTGKRKESATALYYFDARYLDPGTGRFMSPDSAQQIPSPYAYAGSAPLVNVDSDGRRFTPEEVAILWGLLKGKRMSFSALGTEHVHRVPTICDLLVMRAYNISTMLNEGSQRHIYVRSMLEMSPDSLHRRMPVDLSKQYIKAARPVFKSLVRDIRNFRATLVEELGLKSDLSKLEDWDGKLRTVRRKIKTALKGNVNPESFVRSHTGGIRFADRHMASLHDSYNEILENLNELRRGPGLEAKLRTFDVFGATVKQLNIMKEVYIDASHSLDNRFLGQWLTPALKY